MTQNIMHSQIRFVRVGDYVLTQWFDGSNWITAIITYDPEDENER